MNIPVSFPIAKLLKEKGFDKRVKGFYSTEKELHENYVDEMNTKGFANRHLPKGEYSAPTIAEVVMWLYEKHGIWVCVSVDSLFNKGKHTMLIYKNNGFGLELHSIKNDLFGPYDLPTEAYEAAIEYTLNNLI